MRNNDTNGAKISMKDNPNKVSEFFETDFGTRKISDQNFSKILAIPKGALTNCGCNLDEDVQVNVQLVQTGKEKFIKLVPVCGPKTQSKKKKEKK